MKTQTRMKFELEIALGNEAMQTGDDVARALEKVAQTLRRLHADGLVNEIDRIRGESGRIRDENGNAVGEWEAS